MKKMVKDKHSQSGIIAVVLIILLVLAGVVVVWNVVYGLIKKSSSEVQIDTMINRVEVASTKFYATGRTLINVKSNAQTDINKVNIILNLKGGESRIIEKSITIRPMETIPMIVYSNETNLSNSQIISISAVPVFGSKLGMEAKETSPQLDSNGNRILDSPEGIISWWKFDSDARDSVGRNHGTMYGNANIQNSALVLDGSGDYVETSVISTLGKSESASLWIKHAPGGSDYVFFCQDWTRRLYGDVWVFVDNSNIYYYPSANGVNDGNWHHVAYTIDGTRIISYIDGVSKSTNNLNGNYMRDITGYWWFGRLCGGSSCSYYFNGNIKNVMIFNKTLSADEIMGTYLNQK